MNRKNIFKIITILMFISILMVACAPASIEAPAATQVQVASEKPAVNKPPAATEPAVATEVPAALQAPEAGKPSVAKKVVIIGNQKFGDKGPMDDMAAGLDKCASDFGFDIKKIESDPAQFEEDIRSMAREGYDLIITTFPAMTDPTKTVAGEYPNTKFAAVYQFINVQGASVPNLWDTEFHGEQAYYVLGSIAATLSKSKKVGLVSGTEESSINANANAYYRGVKDTCADCTVSQSYVGSFEDPAKAKEIALAMIGKGVDYIQTDAGNSQMGVLEASKESKTLFSGDTSDNFDQYPEGFAGYGAVDFSSNIYMACQYLAQDKFPGGEHGIMNIENHGQYVPFDAFERFGSKNPQYADSVNSAVELAKSLVSKIVSGELVIENNTNSPDWQ